MGWKRTAPRWRCFFQHAPALILFRLQGKLDDNGAQIALSAGVISCFFRCRQANRQAYWMFSEAGQPLHVEAAQPGDRDREL
jgi:hypothetical protein